MSVRIYLDTQAKKETKRIMFVVTIPSARFSLKTTIYIDPKLFNVKTQKISFKELNTKIQAMKQFLDGLESKAILERKPLSKEYIKSEWDTIRGVVTKEGPKQKEFFEYFEYLKDKLKNQQGYGTIKNYTQVKKQLLTFNLNLTFESINEDFYDDYSEFLAIEASNRNTKGQGLSINTIGKHWDKIRKVCREARKDGIAVNPVFEEFTSPSVRVKPIWLTKEEMDRIINVDLDSYDGVVRDEFLARYYTSLRTSDMDLIKESNFTTISDQYYLKLTQMKTKKELFIPLNMKAVEIFEKYNFKLPIIAQQEKNARIKVIAKKAGIDSIVSRLVYHGSKRVESDAEKWSLITTHTARRSYGRRYMESGGDINQLRDLLGHSDSKTTSLYIGWETQALADSVNQIKF
jgi:site-specific recombinase XerC